MPVVIVLGLRAEFPNLQIIAYLLLLNMHGLFTMLMTREAGPKSGITNSFVKTLILVQMYFVTIHRVKWIPIKYYWPYCFKNETLISILKLNYI